MGPGWLYERGGRVYPHNLTDVAQREIDRVCRRLGVQLGACGCCGGIEMWPAGGIAQRGDDTVLAQHMVFNADEPEVES